MWSSHLWPGPEIQLPRTRKEEEVGRGRERQGEGRRRRERQGKVDRGRDRQGQAGRGRVGQREAERGREMDRKRESERERLVDSYLLLKNTRGLLIMCPPFFFRNTSGSM